VQRFSVLYPGKTIEISQVPGEFLTEELIELVRCYNTSTSDQILGETPSFSDSATISDENSLQAQSASLDITNDGEEHVASIYENDFEQIIELSNSISEIPVEGVPTKDLLNNLEANLIRTALAQTDGNVSKASDLLQLGRTSLIQKINKYQLDKG
jgi:sigma-54 specific flagellar transcriptional regulator A